MLNVLFVAHVVPKTLVGMITKILEVSRTLHLGHGASGRSNTRIILKALKYSLSSFVIPVTSKYLVYLTYKFCVNIMYHSLYYYHKLLYSFDLKIMETSAILS